MFDWNKIFKTVTFVSKYITQFELRVTRGKWKSNVVIIITGNKNKIPNTENTSKLTI